MGRVIRRRGSSEESLHGILLREMARSMNYRQEAFKSFGQRSTVVDLAMNLPFIFIYALVADFVIRRLAWALSARRGIG